MVLVSNLVIVVLFLGVVAIAAVAWVWILERGDKPETHEDMRPKSADEIAAAIERIKEVRANGDGDGYQGNTTVPDGARRANRQGSGTR